MAELRVGVRELKSKLSEYLRQVKAGRSVTITDRGVAVGRLVPAGQSLDERIQAMLDAGLAEWNGKPLPPMKPVAKLKRGKSISDMIIEDRR